MERGGVAAMEMLCRDLKSVGTYLSRTISYGPTRLPDGGIVPESAVEYEPLLHRLIQDERAQYDRVADLWSELLVEFEEAEANAGQGRNGNRYAHFYSAQQRFFLQLMMAYTLPDVMAAIETDLREGRSVVLSLFNTSEAQTDRKVRNARASGTELSELDATPREMIVQLIEKHFPIYQYREETDPKTGRVRRVPVLDDAGNPEINRQNQRRQQDLLDRVADLDIPRNPLDAIIARFGVDHVAEISGRTHRFEGNRYVRRKLLGVPWRALNEYETRLFENGTKRIAVISGAGSMGISVHADVAAKNQQRRVFYAFQLSWSADQQMQAFGRVHRSAQSSAPIIRLVLLDLEKAAVRDSYASKVEHFLNRIMVLHVESQNRIFELFHERYVEAVDAAKRQNAFDFGVEESRAHNLRRVAEPETLFVDPGSGARTMLHELEGEVEVVRHGFEAVATSAKVGFYRNKQSRRIYGVSEHRDAEADTLYLTAVKGPRRRLERDELERS